jgi:hypothetical protein
VLVRSFSQDEELRIASHHAYHDIRLLISAQADGSDPVTSAQTG